MVVFLNIKSFNYQSIKNFLKVITCLNLNFLLKIRSNTVSITRNPKVTLYTLLKSPHVNKTAQEQFKKQIYKKNLVLFSAVQLKFLIILKKIQITLFPDIAFTVKLLLNKKSLKTMFRRTLKINNSFLINDYKLKNYILLPASYIKSLDISGEISFNYFSKL